MASFTLGLLYPRYPLNRRLGGLPNHSECFGTEKNRVHLLEFELRTVQPYPSHDIDYAGRAAV